MIDAKFIKALEGKAATLVKERTVVAGKLDVLDARISVIQELVAEECGKAPVENKPAKRTRGPAKKNKVQSASSPVSETKGVDASILAEASKMPGTDPEIAARLSKRPFKPSPREKTSFGAGVHPGVGKPTGPSWTSSLTVSIDDETDSKTS